MPSQQRRVGPATDVGLQGRERVLMTPKSSERFGGYAIERWV
jgi:hypothetical protein